MTWSVNTLTKQKLLVVDDQAINIRILHELFRQQCDVYMATKGDDAIAKCHELKPDLILLDVEMPGISGFEVCQILKSDPALKDIPVIFITGHITAETELKGFELGAVDFIRKPINPLITQVRVNIHLQLKQNADLLRSIAFIDVLTGIANRRQFDETLTADWLQCARQQQPLSLIMLDIDFFKQYNDHYGHHAGDACLQKVAYSLRKLVERPYDLVARYGGEEFVIVLPATDLHGAIHVAKKIVLGVAELGIEHQYSTVSDRVTLSAGVACQIPNSELKPEQLLQLADQELYRAKQKGRNQLSVSLDTGTPYA